MPTAPLAIEEKVREEERARIARDLHDELGAHLTGIKMSMAQLREKLASQKDGAQFHEQVRYTEQLIDDASDAMHEIIDALAPPILEFGLAEAIEWQSRTFTRQTGIVCRQHCSNQINSLDEFKTVALFRIVREALNNVVKYAQADNVDIRIEADEAALHLRIIDDGIGFNADMALGQGSGLANMRRRAQALGGALHIDSAPGKGTSVEVKIPAKA